MPSRVAALVLLAALVAGQDTYGGYTGRWAVVDATAYSPHDAVDSGHWSTRDRITATAKDWRHHPYGIAVPMAKDESGRRCVPLFVPYGTKLIIPRGFGYLDRFQSDDRVFEADDTGGRISQLTEAAVVRDGERAVPVVDLRFRSSADALRWAGPEGRRRLLVFVVEGQAEDPPPVVLPAPAPGLSAEQEQRWQAQTEQLCEAARFWEERARERIRVQQILDWVTSILLVILLVVAVVAAWRSTHKVVRRHRVRAWRAQR